MNDPICGKTIENARKYRDIKLVTTEKRRNYLVSESNYHSTKFFTENVLAIEVRTTQNMINKPVYLRLSVLKLSTIVVYKFCYDYLKPKYGEKSKCYYMIKDNSIVHVKTDDVCKDIAKDVETRFHTLNYK